MTWLMERTDAASGESQDAVTERLLVNVVLQATRTQTGVRGFQHDLDVNDNNGSRLIMEGINEAGAKLIVVSGAFGVGAAPTSPIWLLTGISGYHWLEIGTDRKVYVTNKEGGRISGGSTTLIPTVGLQEVHAIFDGITLPTVWVALVFGATQEIAFDTGLTWTDFWSAAVGALYIGEDLPVGVNRGTKLFGDDYFARPSATAGDAPHLLTYPRPRIDGLALQPPTSEGSHVAWGGTSATPLTWQDVDETPHNADTDIRDTATKNVKHTFKSSGINPVPVGGTPIYVQLRAVCRLLDAAKLGGDVMLRDGLGNESFKVGVLSTTSVNYKGVKSAEMPRPAGGAWVQTDFGPNNMQFGWRSANDPSFDTGPRVTQQLGPEVVYYTDTIPTANLTTPVSAPTTSRRRLLSK